MNIFIYLLTSWIEYFQEKYQVTEFSLRGETNKVWQLIKGCFFFLKGRLNRYKVAKLPFFKD